MAAAVCLTTLTERWIRDRLQLKHPCLADVRTLSLPGTCEEKIGHLGNALNHFIRLKSLDLSYNALISVEGVQHLQMLERLILYYNCIPSREKIKELFELPVLRELDLRLNPLTKNDPHYRLHLVQNMPSLRKLDNCSIRDSERKTAMLQFSDTPALLHSSSLNLPVDQSGDVVLNFVEKHYGNQSEITSNLIHKKAKDPKKEDSNDFINQRSSTPKKESAKSILRYPSNKKYQIESEGSQLNELPLNKSSTSSKASEKPKVSFSPCLERHKKHKDHRKQTRHQAKGHFTPNPDQGHASSFVNIRPPSPLRHGLNLSDPSNPILHPARLTYSSFNRTEGSTNLQLQTEKKKKGSYRKPLEMLLNLVDKHWRGERSLHQNSSFLSQAVQILSMMESDISSREAEVQTLRRDVDALTFQKEDQKSEVRSLSAQLEEARKEGAKLNEQLRIVLEENVSLQKQLIKLERQYLKTMTRTSPISQIREAQAEVEELRKEIEQLRNKVQEAEKVQELSNMLQESHRSLVATNECLVAELRGSGEGKYE